MGNLNLIDGPALDWLRSRREPGPRVWLSDGRVTGAREATTSGLVADATRRLKAARAIRVSTPEAAAHVFRGGRGVGTQTVAEW